MPEINVRHNLQEQFWGFQSLIFDLNDSRLDSLMSKGSKFQILGPKLLNVSEPQNTVLTTGMTKSLLFLKLYAILDFEKISQMKSGEMFL